MPNTLAPKSPQDSASIVSELIMPADANNHGTAFGGAVLAMIDKVAGVCAQRHARGLCVTASIDRVDFREPIHLGELVTVSARVEYVGRTSMLIGVRVEAENLETGRVRLTNVCHLTFVALDQEGRPREVPGLKLASDEERSLFEAGRLRREANNRIRADLGDL